MHEICNNMQYQISWNMHKYSNALSVHNKLKFAKICKTKICTYMQTYHMNKYAQIRKQNMHKYAF